MEEGHELKNNKDFKPRRFKLVTTLALGLRPKQELIRLRVKKEDRECGRL
jgi:hypothetical protein